MILTLLISILVLLFIFSALCRKTPHEKHLSDIQQEDFIREYQHKKNSHL